MTGDGSARTPAATPATRRQAPWTVVARWPATGPVAVPSGGTRTFAGLAESEVGSPPLALDDKCVAVAVDEQAYRLARAVRASQRARTDRPAGAADAGTRALVPALARRGLVAAVLLSLLFPPAAKAGERPWLEIRSPHFTVASNADEKTARRIAFEYEQIAALIPNLWPWARIRTGRPFFVLAVRDEEDMKDLAPAFWERKAGMHPGWVYEAVRDRSYVALRTDLTQLPVYQSYVAVVLSRTFRRELPPWFRVGLGELFSNPEIHEKELRLGAVIPRYVKRLRERGTIDLARLLKVERTSPYYREAETRALFDAESWAFAHYLAFGEKGRLLPKLNRYAALVLENKSPDASMTEAFGNLSDLENGLRGYLHLFAFAYQSFDVGSAPKEAELASRAMPLAESAAMRAAFHVASGRPAEARARLGEAKQADAASAIVYEVEGLLADRESRPEDARTAYTKAVELGGASYYGLYRYAQELRQPRAEAETLARIATTLERVIALSPDYADAHSYQAEILQALGHLNQAEESARRAVALEPEVSHHHLALARVLWNLARQDEARQEAERGMALAVSSADRRSAQGLLDDLSRPSPAATPKAPIDEALVGSGRLGDEAASGRLVADQATPSAEETVPTALLDQLKSPEATTRAAAAKALADSRPVRRGVLEALVNALPDADDQVRSAARAALEQLAHAQEFDGIAAGLNRAPRPIRLSRPAYPREAFDKKVEGKVVVEILIDRDGKVTRARILESVAGLDDAALASVHTWLFTPAVQNGHLILTIANAPVEFRIF